MEDKYLKISKPNGGEQFHLGEETLEEIHWDWVGFAADEGIDQVKILLVDKKLNKTWVIEDKIEPRKSPYTWKVPSVKSGGPVSPGSDYVIRIETLDGNYKEVSNGTFAILEAKKREGGVTEDKHLRIIKPNGGEQFCLGEETINWEWVGFAAEEAIDWIKILLVDKKLNKTWVIEDRIEPRKSAPDSWRVPTVKSGGQVPPGSDYVIRIETLDGNYQDESNETFTILEAKKLEDNGALKKIGEWSGYILTALLSIIGIGFLAVMVWQLHSGSLFQQLSKPELVRGFITFLIAFGTIAIAIVLVIAAFAASNGKSETTTLKDRFGMGKEVLMVLIGILGTIVGFYFGAAEKAPSQELKPPAIEQVRVDKYEPKQGEEITLSFQVIGGKAPYLYTVTLKPDNIAPLKDQTSENGKVSVRIRVPDTTPPNTELTPITIKVTDSDKKTAAQEMKEPKIQVKPR
jgi:hypothetical protein